MRKKPLIILSASILVLLIIGLVITRVGQKKPNVTLQLSPSVSSAKLSDGSIVKQGSFYTKPGSQNITVSFNGFATKTVPFTAPTSGTTKLTVILVPNSQEGYTWLSAHPDEQSVREQLGGTQFHQESQQRQKTNPIISILPHIELYFRIDYGKSQLLPNDSSAVGVYVTFYAPQGKQQALDWLTSKGYDPSKLEIIYTDQSAETTPGNE